MGKRSVRRRRAPASAREAARWGRDAATVALRIRWLNARHAAVKERTLELAAAFEAERGYVPPYWALVDLARRAKSEVPG